MKLETEILEELSQADDVLDSGESKFFGMTYEEGVKAALEWVLGYTNDRPMED